MPSDAIDNGPERQPLDDIEILRSGLTIMVVTIGAGLKHLPPELAGPEVVAAARAGVDEFIKASPHDWPQIREAASRLAECWQPLHAAGLDTYWLFSLALLSGEEGWIGSRKVTLQEVARLVEGCLAALKVANSK